MKVLLVRPPLPRRTIGAAHASLCEPLELEVLAGNLRDHDVTVLDMRVDPRPFDDVLAAVKPDLVGVTSGTAEVNAARALLRRVREVFPAVGTVVGGPHATVRPADFAQEFITAVVVGEGVVTLRELVEARERGRGLDGVGGLALLANGRQVLTAARPPAASLGELPAPDRRTTAGYRRHYYHAWVRPAMLVQASTGATGPGTVGGQKDAPRRVQAMERVAAEVADQAEAMILADDDALAEPERVATLCKLLDEAHVRRPIYLCTTALAVADNPELIEDLADLGLVAVALALKGEPGGGLGPTERRAVDILHRDGVSVAGELLIEPRADVEDIRRLGELATDQGIEFPIFSTPTPFPGTPLWDEVRPLLGTPDWELFDRVHSVLPTRLPLRTFYAEVARLYDKAYGATAVPRLLRSVPIRELPGLALGLHRFAARVRKAHLDQEIGLHDVT